MAKNLVIIVVPGGLGTTLSLNGTTVWDFNLLPPRLDGVRMLLDPALLAPWLHLDPGALLSVYDDLTTFLVKSGYVKGKDLFLWGYDWRQGVERNAEELGRFVKGLALGGNKILFIAHSSGCMVVRWALLFDTAKNPGVPIINSALVDTVVAAGPPMLGMACPLKDILLMPKLNDTFDALFKLVQLAYPALAAQVSVPLNRILMAVTAQLEGLPPNDLAMLGGGSTPSLSPFGAFDWNGWPEELASLLAAVKATRDKLKASKWGAVKCTVIASDQHETDTGYNLDANDEYLNDWGPDDGDGSVLLSR